VPDGSVPSGRFSKLVNPTRGNHTARRYQRRARRWTGYCSDERLVPGSRGSVDAWEYGRIAGAARLRAARSPRGPVVLAQPECPGCPLLRRRQYRLERPPRPEG